MKKSILSLVFLCATYACFANEPLTVIETTFKPSNGVDTEFYFGFCKGDQIVFSLEVLKGRPIREIEVSEFGGNTRFSDIKTNEIADRTITVSSTGIYKFRIRGAFWTKKCRLSIKRIPVSSESIDFNTNIQWEMVNDTSYYTVQERYLASKDTAIVNLDQRTEKVHSVGNLNGSRNTFNFILPPNTATWSYYIGVNQEGQQAFENATDNLAKHASPIVSKIPGYGPLAALALGGVSYLTKLQRGEDIEYYIVENGQQGIFLDGYIPRYLKKGKVTNDFSQMSPRSGMLHVCLKNDNAITGVQVMVKITAITITENWEVREVEKCKVTPVRRPILMN